MSAAPVEAESSIDLIPVERFASICMYNIVFHLFNIEHLASSPPFATVTIGHK